MIQLIEMQHILVGLRFCPDCLIGVTKEGQQIVVKLILPTEVVIPKQE
jgi:hypothetical protein